MREDIEKIINSKYTNKRKVNAIMKLINEDHIKNEPPRSLGYVTNHRGDYVNSGAPR